MKLPVKYSELSSGKKRQVREQYIKLQNGNCWYCKSKLEQDAPEWVTCRPIDMGLFPPGMLRHPIHLQHDHKTDMTEGAVHAYCNCVLWQYYGR